MRATASAAGSSPSADVHALAAEIGPRGTGTAGEAAAADYASGRLAALGLPVTTRNFRAVHSQNAFPLAADVLALFGVVVGAVGGRPGRWMAACYVRALLDDLDRGGDESCPDMEGTACARS